MSTMRVVRVIGLLALLLIIATSCSDGADEDSVTTTVDETTTTGPIAGGVEDDEPSCAIRSLVIPTDVDVLWLSAGVGDIKITGSPQPQIDIKGVACAEDSGSLTALDFSFEEHDERLVVIDAASGAGSGSLTFEARIPPEMFVDLDVVEGRVTMTGLGQVTLTNEGQGPASISDIAGDVLIIDGPGPLTVERIGGSVELEEDAGGGAVIVDVTGDVEIVLVEGPETIVVDGVGGDVIKWYDADVDARNVSGLIRATG